MRTEIRPALKVAICVFLLSLAVRLVWVWFAHVTPISDFNGYDRLAWKWLTTGEFGSRSALAYRTPAYPGMLASVYYCFGHSWKAAGLVQAVLGAATSGLLVLLAGRVVSRWAAAVAGLLHALSPTALAYVPVLASENLAVPLIIGGLLCLSAASGPLRVRRESLIAGSGLLFGLLLLVRPAGVFFLPALLLLALYSPRERRWRVLSPIIFLAVAGATLLPWLMRNHRAGLPMPTLTTTGGVNLWMGNNDLAVNGGYSKAAQWKRRLGEAERDRAYKAAALHWIRERPGRYLGLCRARAVRLLGTEPDIWAGHYLLPTGENDRAIVAQYYKKLDGADGEALRKRARDVRTRCDKFLQRLRRVMAPLALVALLLGLVHWRRYAIVLLPALCYLGGIILTFAAPRFRELANPLWYVLVAGLLADALWGAAEFGRRWRWLKITAVLLAIAATVALDKSDRLQRWERVPAESVRRFGADLSPITFAAPPEQYTVRAGPVKQVSVARAGDGLRCDVVTNPKAGGGQYGGVHVPVPTASGLRLKITFECPRNIEAVYVDAYDAVGERVRRWVWYFSSAQMPSRGRAIYDFLPGNPAGYFIPKGVALADRFASFKLFVRVAPDAEAGFVLHTAEVRLDKAQTTRR